MTKIFISIVCFKGKDSRKDLKKVLEETKLQKMIETLQTGWVDPSTKQEHKFNFKYRIDYASHQSFWGKDFCVLCRINRVFRGLDFDDDGTIRNRLLKTWEEAGFELPTEQPKTLDEVIIKGLIKGVSRQQLIIDLLLHGLKREVERFLNQDVRALIGDGAKTKWGKTARNEKLKHFEKLFQELIETGFELKCVVPASQMKGKTAIQQFQLEKTYWKTQSKPQIEEFKLDGVQAKKCLLHYEKLLEPLSPSKKRLEKWKTFIILLDALRVTSEIGTNKNLFGKNVQSHRLYIDKILF